VRDVGSSDGRHLDLQGRCGGAGRRVAVRTPPTVGRHRSAAPGRRTRSSWDARPVPGRSADPGCAGSRTARDL
jgi:hypothetical protein